MNRLHVRTVTCDINNAKSPHITQCNDVMLYSSSDDTEYISKII